MDMASPTRLIRRNVKKRQPGKRLNNRNEPCNGARRIKPEADRANETHLSGARESERIVRYHVARTVARCALYILCCGRSGGMAQIFVRAFVRIYDPTGFNKM